MINFSLWTFEVTETCRKGHVTLQSRRYLHCTTDDICVQYLCRQVGIRSSEKSVFYIWVSEHHNLIYIKRTNVMQLGSMFICNCNIALHVSDAFCVLLQEHLETVEASHIVYRTAVLYTI